MFKSLFLIPATLGLSGVAHAQTTLFSEQFDLPLRWSTPVRSPANVKQYQGTDWLQYPPLGNVSPESFNLLFTEWGNKPVPLAGDGAEGNFLRFKLSTYNPNNSKANHAAKYLWGTELQTLRKFGPPLPGHAIDFESRSRMPVMAPRMISSFYTYSQRQSGGTVFSDEVDFEYLGDDFGNEVLLTNWNNFARRNDTDTIPGQGYGDGVHHQSAMTGTGNTLPNGVDRKQWHLLRVRWVCSSPGVYRIEFGSKQNAADPYRTLQTLSAAAPDEAMAVHLNIWATNPDPQPTSAPGTNYIMDVDWCRVSDVVLPAALLKPKPKVSGGRS